MALVVKNPHANAGGLRDMGLVPGSGRSHGGRNSNSLQYSCQGNPMDKGAWWGHQESDTTEVTEHSTGYISLKSYILSLFFFRR